MVRSQMTVAGLFALVVIVTPAAAQDAGWLHDFNTARQEAKAKNRPLVLDFGTGNCFWCKKLDQTTFRDPAVARRLAEQFVAVKIDADQEVALAQHLGISSYPTLVFAAPDGRILGKHAGYVETARFQQQLDRALQESKLAPKQTDLASAPPPSSVRGVAPAETVVEPLLRQIRADYASRQYLCCLQRCKDLLAAVPSSPDAAEAKRIADDIKADPEKARLVQASLLETLGDLHLGLAESALRDGRPQEAAAHIERIQQIVPGSFQASAARSLELIIRSKALGQESGSKQSP